MSTRSLGGFLQFRRLFGLLNKKNNICTGFDVAKVLFVQVQGRVYEMLFVFYSILDSNVVNIFCRKSRNSSSVTF